MKARTVYLSQQEVEIIGKIGDGNVSKGMRMLVAASVDAKPGDLLEDLNRTLERAQALASQISKKLAYVDLDTAMPAIDKAMLDAQVSTDDDDDDDEFSDFGVDPLA